jgi:hypothetical protein
VLKPQAAAPVVITGMVFVIAGATSMNMGTIAAAALVIE